MQQKVNINLQPINKKLTVNSGTPLIDVLHEYGVEFPCGGKGTCGRCKVQLLDGNLEKGLEQQQKLNKLGLGEDWRLACYCAVESDITLEVAQFENIILADNTTFEFQPRKGFGVAVDVGTTTLVVQLLNLKNGQIMDAVTDVNLQARFGADLISRIQSCLDGKQKELQTLIRQKIGAMIASILAKHPEHISAVILVGNTVMHHIFSGLNVQPLSFYPFESPDLGVKKFTATALGWELPETTAIRFYPSIGSFVGSDILAGIAATKMAERETFSVLIDLGTNGEIVIGNKEQILCASTAAGPAFEGAKISQGMRATTGAVSSVTASPNPSEGGEKDQLSCHVIGNVKAKGICDSGLIDAMAILLRQEKIGLFGEINSGEEKIELAPGVFLTQQDIREFQLAKAAIAAGLQILLNRLEITFNEIDQVFIAGGFGNFLNIQHVIETGLIETTEDKIVKLGNTALIGAKMFLFEEENFIQQILTKTVHINLEGDPAFQDIYIEKMMLG
ncbi:MAG TPA: ASKHA domain-containing protein [Draconibacterium sp.]|nr:ASKHA domain-containing protein [Draconibacterium sp.]